MLVLIYFNINSKAIALIRDRVYYVYLLTSISALSISKK